MSCSPKGEEWKEVERLWKKEVGWREILWPPTPKLLLMGVRLIRFPGRFWTVRGERCFDFIRDRHDGMGGVFYVPVTSQIVQGGIVIETLSWPAWLNGTWTSWSYPWDNRPPIFFWWGGILGVTWNYKLPASEVKFRIEELERLVLFISSAIFNNSNWRRHFRLFHLLQFLYQFERSEFVFWTESWYWMCGSFSRTPGSVESSTLSFSVEPAWFVVELFQDFLHFLVRGYVDGRVPALMSMEVLAVCW